MLTSMLRAWMEDNMWGEMWIDVDSLVESGADTVRGGDHTNSKGEMPTHRHTCRQ